MDNFKRLRKYYYVDDFDIHHYHGKTYNRYSYTLYKDDGASFNAVNFKVHYHVKDALKYAFQTADEMMASSESLRDAAAELCEQHDTTT